MLFNSYVFVLVFLPVVLALWWAAATRPTWRFALLTAASYLFYGWWDWRFCGLLLASTLIDWLAGRRLFEADAGATRKAWLLLSLAANLGFLGVFKYGGFFARMVESVAGWWGIGGWTTVPAIVLPVGISFYTFQSMSYTIDIYRGVSKPAGSAWHFAAYVSMFPQLVAGPIVRYAEIEAQLRAPATSVDWTQAFRGVSYFTFGMAQKVLVADTLARYVDPALRQYARLGLVESWQGMLGYTCQLYFDFAGYSNMAIGLGLMLGFVLPANFDSPYKSRNIGEFWRRWHMTLSGWFRDYLYVPLGGGRRGSVITLRNVAIVMFLGGLWHGAAWTFVFWGLYHGLLLIAYHLLSKAGLPPLPKPVAVALTFVAVVVGWVIFRAQSVDMAVSLFGSMSGFNGVGPPAWGSLWASGAVELLLALGLVFMAPNVAQLQKKVAPTAANATALAVLLAACILRFANPSPFLYFQF